MDKKIVGVLLIAILTVVLVASLSYVFSQPNQTSNTPTPSSSPTPTAYPSETPTDASIPTPSAPEFSVTGQWLSGWGDGVRLSVTIKNQPFTPYTEADSSSVDLFYNVSWKGHDADTWNYYHHNTYQVDYFKASSSNETFISLDLSGSELGGIFAGGQADIRVQALIGGYTYYRQPFYPMDVYDVKFTGQTSGWSSTQTIIIP